MQSERHQHQPPEICCGTPTGQANRRVDPVIARPKPAAAAILRQPKSTLPPLDASAISFDKLCCRQPNEVATRAARRVCRRGPVTFNPLFLYEWRRSG